MITLASDFGSPYPAAMKGVILSRTDTRLVDVAHDLPRQDPRAGAFWLREVLPYFPPAVHLVVVDPGVGTDRRVLIVEAGDHRLVGPDNGILVPVAERLAADPTYYAGSATDPESTTFHGRDVFAPLAAEIQDLGLESTVEREGFAPIEDVTRIEFPTATIEGAEAIGEVLVVDDFGNTITNIPGSFLDEYAQDSILVDGRQTPVARTYAEVPPTESVATVGSHGNVELAVNRGRGDRVFGLEPGDPVYLAPVENATD
ncbi:S-adenosylmethionine hydroxide adenosyltransferase [Halodesulfurarchaeum formicicum]|uniref:S-adenosylmethionine hydroxide adenosyltransferase n=1 Tax=Halodesulfurarchaeum formicicum TaxID=1873524 RepID=A0A1D8S5J5_9EURY|nr:SAM-dependent chlorinase/fluorinase [Halodesulfurarchaeum formicicum]AOW80623.1 S-adenosylmethionine hydroxide adenosyltransferase [Halodesulfurarchaeum formicicum]APE95962.1 S-adenosylmethionine hydroxide adenosyltransferase [Halodesulfurarchaeum formicicum]